MYTLPIELTNIVKPKHLQFYMNIAKQTAALSSAQRRRVGAIIVSKNRAMWLGYNGTPAGMPNVCEDEHNVTFPYVIHAEANALDKLALEGVSAEGAVCFVTCFHVWSAPSDYVQLELNLYSI